MKALQKRLVSIEGDAMERNGYLAVVEREDYPDNPRDYGTSPFSLVMPGRQTDAGASFGDLLERMAAKWDSGKWGGFPEDVDEHDLGKVKALAEKTGIPFFPVFFRQHGLVEYAAAPFGDRWDSGVAGYAYATDEGMKEAYDGDPGAEALRDRLQGELEELADYANGNVFYCRVYGPESWSLENGSAVLGEDADPVEECGNLFGEESVACFIDDSCGPAEEGGPRP